MAEHGHDRPTTSDIVNLGRMALAFGRVDRMTYHEDGTAPESDTDHTVMLGLIGCAFASAHPELDLDLGLVAQYALIHDLVEVYAGDTPTLRILSAGEKRAKAEREHDAYLRIAAQFGARLPWVADTIAAYEKRRCPEARFVKALDKLLPAITHVLNGSTVMDEQHMSRAELVARFEDQQRELESYAADFPPLFDLRADLVALVLDQMTTTEPTTNRAGAPRG